MNATLPDSAERALLTKAIAELTRLTGTKPTGYRAPSWNFSPNTLSILRDLGFRYESSLMADESPYELLQNGKPTGLVELPVEWIMDAHLRASLTHRGARAADRAHPAEGAGQGMVRDAR
jgi:peptidoglycan/xylan/chitin deacetylase (PgdA/CDA1 family)